MARKILKISAIVIAALFILALIIPFAFKGKITEAVKKEASSSLNASMDFKKVSLSLIRHFPNFTLNLKNLTIVGKDEFKDDTLANIPSLQVVVNIASVIKGSNYEIRKIIIDDPRLLFKVLSNGKANWDIVKKTEEKPQAEPSQPSNFRMTLHKLAINHAYVVYEDATLNTKVEVKDLNHTLSGDFTADFTRLKTKTEIAALTLDYGGIRYLSRTKVVLNAPLDADLKNMKFTFTDVTLGLNDLLLGATGWFSMPANGYGMDIKFNAKQNEFKAFLSLIPAVYSKDFSSVETKGSLAFDGYAKGVYNDKSIPAFGLHLNVANAMFKYPSLPAAVTNINIDAKVDNPTGVPDATAIDVPKMHLEMAGNPVDIVLSVRTPVSDPQIAGKIKGAFNLADIAKIYPLEKGTTMSGMVKADVNLNGRLSSIEKEKYDEFKANGNITASNIIYKMPGLPQTIQLPTAQLLFSPAYIELAAFSLKAGKSDLSAKGKLQNYLAYFLKKNGVLTGTLTTNSSLINAADFMAASTTTSAKSDTASTLSVVEIPANIDFTMNSSFGKIIYNKYEMTHVAGIVRIKDRELLLDGLKLNMLDGQITMNGKYNTLNPKKPLVDFAFDISQVDVKKAFKTFNTVQKLVPIAEKTSGRISTKMVLKTALDEHMNPVLSTLNGNGTLTSPLLQIENVSTLNKIAEVLKMDKFRKLSLEKINLSYEFTDGKVYVKPFDIKTGNIKTNLSGWTAFDKTIGYTMNLDIPRSEFGGKANGVLNNLISDANKKTGSNIKAGETIPVALIIGGTITNPTIKTGLKSVMASAVEDLKNQAKEELQKKKEEVVAKVKTEVNNLISDADARAAKLIDEAQKQADNITKTAQAAADKVKTEAAKQADQLITEGNKKGAIAGFAAKKAADKVKKEADVKAGKLVDEARKQSQSVIDKARAEADKLKQDARTKVNK